MTKIQVCRDCGQEIHTKKMYKPIRGYTIAKFNLDGTKHVDVYVEKFPNSGMADSL